LTYQNTKNIIVLYEYKYIIRKIDKMLISENGGNFMALSKKPVTGMKDILPEEMQIRVLDLHQLKLLVWRILQTSPANRVEKMKNSFSKY
jgi:hypothetical protein